MVTKSKKTSRSRANMSQKKYADMFKNFIESASEAFVLLDENLTCLSINEAGARLLGMSQRELIGKNVVDTVPNIKESGRYDIYMNVIRTGEPFYSDEVIPHHKFGDLRLTVKAFKVGDGLGMIVNDITKHKKAEDALQRSEDFFRSIIENALDGIVVLNMDGKVIYGSPSIEHILGYGRKDLIGTPWVEFVHPDEITVDVNNFSKMSQNPETSVLMESVVRHKDGSWRIVEAVASPIPVNGEVKGIVVNWREITERKRLEKLLQESEKRYKDIVENSVDGIYQVDTSGKFMFINDSFASTFGYKREELTGKHFSIIMDTETSSKVAKIVVSVFSGKNVRGEVTVQHKKGNRIPVSFGVTPLKREGKIIGLSGILRDVTELKRVEEELHNLSSHLQQAREAERELVARLIHDELGQTLTALKMDLAWLNNRLNAEQKPLHNKTRAMLELTDKAIQTVRTLSSELSPKVIEDLGLGAALDWLVEEFQNRTGIKCKLTHKSDDITLERERATAVFRIFQEALTNIARHANATKVNISLREADSKFMLRIVDNGKGITREQVSNPRSFGLMGMRERARFCGGEVEILGSRNKGTAVIVRIPVNKKGPR